MIHLRSFLVAFVLALGTALSAQTFVNGDLEGQVGPSETSVIPPGWQAVPFLDPVCAASADYGATPDLMNAQGPLYDNGLMGNPRSGQSFVSGLHAFGSHHEGLKQTVNGFVVGCSYTIGLYQTVSKQISSDALDPTGSWSVYAENALIGVTAPTTSTEPAISLNKPWERRELSFTATATTHIIKFMPTDDDAEWITDGVRMGIDSVWIEASVPGGTVLADLGNDTTLCPGAELLLDPGAGVSDIVWQDGSMGQTFTVTEPGIYWVEVSVGCGVDRDSITVDILDLPSVDLGEAVLLCPDGAVLLDATLPGSTYRWSDGSTGAQLLAVPTAIYWVEVTNSCGLARDTVTVGLQPLPLVGLGEDRLLCDGTTEVLGVEQAGATYLWSDGTSEPTLAVTDPGVYSVVVTLNGCTAADEVRIDYEPCVFELVLPNVITPNGSGSNDLLVPVSAKGIASMRTTIYNRWGMEVFSTGSADIRWNGIGPSGDPVPDGVYFWEVRFVPQRGEPGVMTGTLMLLR